MQLRTPHFGHGKRLRIIRRARYVLRPMSIFFLVCTVAPPAAVAGDDIERSGDIVATVLPVMAFAATLKEADREGTWQFAKTVLISQAMVHTLKRTVDRTRPDGGRHSFPSGHTSAAFLGPGFVHLRYGLKYAWPMYIAAGWVGFTRVDSDRHYETDVAAGAAITMLTCVLIVNPFVSNVEASAVWLPEYRGLRISLRI